jgi:hypothetical protein
VIDNPYTQPGRVHPETCVRSCLIVPELVVRDEGFGAVLA